MFILRHRIIWYLLSGIPLTVMLVLYLRFGFVLGIDFTGGSLLTARFEEVPSAATAQEVLTPLNLGPLTIQTSGEDELTVRARTLTNEEKNGILDAFRARFENVEETRFESIGPVIGKELTRRAVVALSIVAGGIILYLAYAFRGVSRVVSPWAYGVIAVVTLLHDVGFVAGLFVVLGVLKLTEIDSLFVTALLTVLGFSVFDTIVVFDRIRETTKRDSHRSFEEIVGQSIEETVVRSINTSLTIVLVLLALLLFGSSAIRFFVVALLTGSVVGTYSSISIASPLLYDWWRFKGRLRRQIR